MRPALLAAALLYPAPVWNPIAVNHWAPIIIVLDDRHAEWCPDCAWLPSLGVHPVARRGR